MTDEQQVEAEGADRELPEIDPDTLTPIEPIVVPEATPVKEVEEPLTLIDESDGPVDGMSKIRAAGSGALHAQQTEFKRPLNVTGNGATRCKLFHSKISPVPMEYLEKQINEWVDTGEIEIKAVSTVVGIMEGKRAEANLIVTLWY